MKTNGTLVNLSISILVTGLLFSSNVLAQPDYAFKNATLVSGTDKKTGAKYLFKNVRSGTDAFVTITDIKKVTLSDLDGPSGHNDAFQPYIFCPAKTKGFVEFRFDFVNAGTSTPKVMLEVPVTAIDIDGYIFPDEKVYEFDEFNLTPAYYVNYDLIGSALSVSYTASSVTAINKTAVDYPGIDTTKRDVMFSMVYSNVSSITIRAGVDNKSKEDVTRLRSDYFKKFIFPSSQLAKFSLMSFRGAEKNKKVDLQWELTADNQVEKVIIERAAASGAFEAVGEVWMSSNTHLRKEFHFSDPAAINNLAYYRLKLVGVNGTMQYSNVLVFRSAGLVAQPFNVYPSAIQSTATLQVKAAKTGSALFQVVDYAGRVVMQQNMTLQEGTNNIVVNNMNTLLAGNYVVLVKMDGQVYNQKVVKR
jgi:hypothetical protein